MILVSRISDWRSPPVGVATAVRHRFRGLRHPVEDGALLLHTRSVHSFGMKEALWIVELADGSRPVHTALLLPRRVYLSRTPGWILELPGRWAPPPLGRRLELLPAES